MSRQAYNEQKRNADRRSIPFLFSYEEWVSWWMCQLGPDWQRMRGCSKGKYCMARHGDTGAYEPKNVKCIRHADNVTDAAVNDTIAFGEAQGQAVLSPEIVRDIFVSEMKVQDLADHYGVSVGTVNDIRSQRTWTRATKGLHRQSQRGRNQWS